MENHSALSGQPSGLMVGPFSTRRADARLSTITEG
jgi:hypothetical protein